MKEQYKLNHLKCFLLSFKDTISCFYDWLDNDYLGIILANIIAVLGVIILFPVFIILALIWYIKRVVMIKKKINFLKDSVINTLKKRKIIKEIKTQE